MAPVLRHSLLTALAVAALVLGIRYFLPATKQPDQAFAILDDPAMVVIAEPGPGFYGVERKDLSRWSWSGGEAVLRLRHPGFDGTPHSLRLSFLLHSTTPRTLTIRYGGFIIWRGAVEARRTPVVIPLLTLTGPQAELVFTSDRPGEILPDGSDPRPLAFALYDLVLTRAE
jgi:hypothetical protein